LILLDLFFIINIVTQVDMLETEDCEEKMHFKARVGAKSHSAKVRQSYSRDPFNPLPGRSWKRSLVQSKQLQPDYMSSR